MRTGKPSWIFHTVPQAGEFGNDTWENESWQYTGNTNNWTLMSADEELVYDFTNPSVANRSQETSECLSLKKYVEEAFLWRV